MDHRPVGWHDQFRARVSAVLRFHRLSASRAHSVRSHLRRAEKGIVHREAGTWREAEWQADPCKHYRFAERLAARDRVSLRSPRAAPLLFVLLGSIHDAL